MQMLTAFSPRAQVEDIDNILNRWGIKKATFVGHSYGSVILSWMIQQVASPCHSRVLALFESIWAHHSKHFRRGWMIDLYWRSFFKTSDDKATFVGHSYGSVILSWMIQQVRAASKTIA